MSPDKNVYRRQKYGRKVRVNFNAVEEVSGGQKGPFLSRMNRDLDLWR